ncbi:MAG: hypothetical protein JNK74_01865 [Candidatus Hydrogenedentes bacterium]|nr:hypothetical protein [Candidatus Hydrogenedentota bacterium]
MPRLYRSTRIPLLILAMAALGLARIATAAAGHDVQARIDGDLDAGKPVVVHVVVALCDNVNQGIVPVPKAIGNGQDPDNNLYWGAMHGVRHFLPKKAGWTKVDSSAKQDSRILERAVFHTEVRRGPKSCPVYLVADAWDGARIRDAMTAYFTMTAGALEERVSIRNDDTDLTIDAGGAAHLLVFVGHNGLMDFDLNAPAASFPDLPPRSAAALACASKPYFEERLTAVGAHALLLTTGLMAPEAYTLDGAIRAWASGGDVAATVEAAATSYNQYQKCGMKGARRLFWGATE